MRHNHLWRAPSNRRPIDPILVLQWIGAVGMLLVGLCTLTLILVAAGD